MIRTAEPAKGRLKVHGNNGSSPLILDEDVVSGENYLRLGERLAKTGDVYRAPGGQGLILVSADGQPVHLVTGKDLLPVVVDRLDVLVLRHGKPQGSLRVGAHFGRFRLAR